jgi:hypothetical protein
LQRHGPAKRRDDVAVSFNFARELHELTRKSGEKYFYWRSFA